MPERFTNERFGQWINENVDVIRRSIVVLAEFTQFHQTIRVVFCQLCIALGRPWNAGDENGQSRTRRVMNLYHLLEMPAWDVLTQNKMPIVISETVHKGLHMCTNQRPKARSIICTALLELPFEENPADPDTNLQIRTVAKFLQHAGQTSFASLLEGLLAYVPEILQDPLFSRYCPGIDRVASNYFAQSQNMRPFICLLGLDGHLDVSARAFCAVSDANCRFISNLEGTYQNVQSEGNTAAEHMFQAAWSSYCTGREEPSIISIVL